MLGNQHAERGRVPKHQEQDTEKKVLGPEV